MLAPGTVILLAVLGTIVPASGIWSATPPGTPILMTAQCAWQDASGRFYASSGERTVVVKNPAFTGRTFYCATAAGRRWKDAQGAVHEWNNALIGGVRVRWPQRVGAGWITVEGDATNDGRVCVDGELVRIP